MFSAGAKTGQWHKMSPLWPTLFFLSWNISGTHQLSLKLFALHVPLLRLRRHAWWFQHIFEPKCQQHQLGQSLPPLGDLSCSKKSYIWLWVKTIGYLKKYPVSKGKHVPQNLWSSVGLYFLTQSHSRHCAISSAMKYLKISRPVLSITLRNAKPRKLGGSWGFSWICHGFSWDFLHRFLTHHILDIIKLRPWTLVKQVQQQPQKMTGESASLVEVAAFTSKSWLLPRKQIIC